jgi:hypothetical protein
MRNVLGLSFADAKEDAQVPLEIDSGLFQLFWINKARVQITKIFFALLGHAGRLARAEIAVQTSCAFSGEE